MRLGWHLALGAWLASIGCKGDARSGAAASASASTPAALVKPPSTPPACRVIQVKGEVRSDAGSLALLSPVDGRTWFTLAEGAELALRHGVSAREFEVRGPARVLPCRGGLEQVLVSSGRVKSAPGTGVRPGGEFLVATPLGSMAYGDADLEVVVGASSLELELRRGELVTELVPGTSGYPEGGLKSPGRARVEGPVNPAKLLEACEASAKAAIESAGRVLSAAEKPAMGKEAANQLVVRRRARAVCAISAAGVEREPDPSKKSALSQRLVTAEQAWRTVPSR